MAASLLNRWNNLGLGVRIVSTCAVVIVGVVAINYYVFSDRYRNDVQEELMMRAAAFSAVADETKDHVGMLHGVGAFDTERLLSEALEHVAKGGSYRDTDFFNVIPVVAGWTAAEEAAQKEGLNFHIYAYNARTKDHEPARDSFVGTMLTELTQQVTAGELAALGAVDRIVAEVPDAADEPIRFVRRLAGVIEDEIAVARTVQGLHRSRSGAIGG